MIEILGCGARHAPSTIVAGPLAKYLPSRRQRDSRAWRARVVMGLVTPGRDSGRDMAAQPVDVAGGARAVVRQQAWPGSAGEAISLGLARESGLGFGQSRSAPVPKSELPYEPVPKTWSHATSKVARALRLKPPSQLLPDRIRRPHRQR